MLKKKWGIGLPALFSGLYFGAMHIVLVNRIGPAVVGVMMLAALLGIAAGHHREKTGSLIPAIIIHVPFNVGGMLPAWLLTWLFS